MFKTKKTSVLKKWWFWIALIAVCSIGIVFSVIEENKAVDIEWSSLVMGDCLPVPELTKGHINYNSVQTLDIDIKDSKHEDYKEYLGKCIDFGFTVDKVETENSYRAYNATGHYLDLYFRESKSELCINLYCPRVFGTLLWPNSEMAQLLPTPDSDSGDIFEDTKSKFNADIANISLEEYKNYITACAEKGFNIEVKSTEKSYSAKNADGYKLSVDYIGFNTITITMIEPEYQIDIEVECVQNMVFSTYDIRVYLNNSYEKDIKHGSKDTLSFILPKNTYTLKFESSADSNVTGMTSIKVENNDTIKLKLTCTSEKIKIKTIGETVADPTSLENENITNPQSTDNQATTELISDVQTTEKQEVETDLETATSENVTWKGKKITIDDISAAWQCEYAHIDSDIMRLGNYEEGVIEISIFDDNVTEDDIIILYDDTLLTLSTDEPVYSNNKTIITAHITGKSEGVSDIAICTAYDLAVLGEEANGLVITVKKYNSTDGQIVYVAPSGEKYHYSNSCAGGSAKATTFDEAKLYDYTPCGNCA